MGHYLRSVVSFEKARKKSVRGQTHSASYFERAFSKRRPNSAKGGLRFRYEENGLRQVDPPRASSACEAVALGGAVDSRVPDSKKIIAEMHPKEIIPRRLCHMGRCLGPSVEASFGWFR